jgi:hypothetical protein
MRWLILGCWLILGALVFSSSAFAQDKTLPLSEEPAAPFREEPATQVNESTDATQAAPVPGNTAPANAAARGGGGVVSLQTTVTGNQEQPRVLYILPWQSPPASEVDFELLDSRQSSVFGHIERNELRRELEAAGEFDE